MSYSTQRAVSIDGMLALLDIEIEYFGREEISVYFDSVQDAHPWNWVGTSEHQIAFSPPVPIGVEVLVKRSTDISQPRHVFSQGAAFEEAVLDEVLLQTLHIAQEARENATIEEVFTNLNMHGYRLTNVGDPIDPLDGVNLRTFGTHDATIVGYRDQCAASAVEAALSADEAAASAASVNAANLAHVNGDNAVGTWSISISGTAAEATHAATADAATHAATAGSATTADSATTAGSAASVGVGAVSASNQIVDSIITPSHLVQRPSELTSSTPGSGVQAIGIPTWATEVIITMHSLLPSASARLVVQVGSGTFLTTGYSGFCLERPTGDSTLSTGFPVTFAANAAAYTGTIRLVKLSATSTVWVESSSGVSNTLMQVGAGSVDVSGTLDRCRVVRTDGGTFTSGTVTIKWR